jgi:PKD repeat protein
MTIMQRYLLLFATIILASCKREPYPVAEVSEPEFKVSGTENGIPFTFSAGVNGLKLTSEITHDIFGVHNFVSTIAPSGCEGCGPSLRFALNDTEVLIEDQTPDPDHVLIPQQLPFAISSANSDFLSIQFDLPEGQNANVIWDFGDSNTSNILEPIHQYAAAGSYDVTAEYSSGSGVDLCQVNITQTIAVGSNLVCALPFDIQFEENDEVHLHYPQNMPPYLTPTSWTINGSNFNGNGQEVNVGNGQNTICLNYFNSELNCTGIFCLEFNNNDGPDICVNHFHYHWNALSVNLGNVEITYTKADGSVYTSVTSLNTNSNHFTIISSEDYTPMINGSLARKISAVFTVKMVNLDDPSDIIILENANTQIGFIIN